MIYISLQWYISPSNEMYLLHIYLVLMIYISLQWYVSPSNEMYLLAMIYISRSNDIYLLQTTYISPATETAKNLKAIYIFAISLN